MQNGDNLSFNTQPPEGGWCFIRIVYAVLYVSTHSRLKAAGKEERVPRLLKLFQHTAA